jgi:hypothetical protein
MASAQPDGSSFRWIQGDTYLRHAYYPRKNHINTATSWHARCGGYGEGDDGHGNCRICALLIEKDMLNASNQT